jgi:NADH-quinone oxidoreductase subunit L
MNLTWLLLLLPLFSAFLTLVWLAPKPAYAKAISIFSAAVGFVISAGLTQGWFVAPEPLVWMDFVGLRIQIGMLIDPLSKMMLLVVTGVGFLIHVFSVGYMAEDPGLGRFFGKLSLFMFSMVGIVVADNLAMMFIFWELVGLSSYLLIGFWFEKPSAAEAAKKAFLTNRIGDFGFMLGILMVWSAFGVVGFGALQAEIAKNAGALGGLATVVALLLFCGCVGKSAQLPLHVWLPDAMEGPTPVSALIHAATMVAAGVYMLCRIYFILELSPVALEVIAGIGCATAVFAAVVATQQNDIKRILAYSTLSQLGYMVMAVGSGGPTAAMFHLSTHAFFKALLFLGAASVIHAVHHEQDIWKMGGLWKKIPVTFWTFLAGTLALAGVWPLSGFFSKDEILLVTFARNPVMGCLGVLTAGLTTYYMLRLVIVAFFGEPRSEAASHAHESPWIMTIPLALLALLSVIGGFIGLGHALDAQFPGAHVPHDNVFGVIAASTAAFAVGLLMAWRFYWGAREDAHVVPTIANKFYIDEIYEAVLLRFQQFVARVLAWIDNWILGGFVVRGAANVTDMTGELLRLFQAGNLQVYSFLFGLGAALVVYFFLIV